MGQTGEQRLGRYTILGELGRGGHATVYKALEPDLEREVALKVLHPALHSDPDFILRFRREAKALAALRHPHVVVIYEVGEADGRMYIAMELAHGQSLAQRISEQGPIPWPETLAIMQQVCAALQYAHNQGIIHRDLKPSNILLDQDRGVLLSDFGLARLVSTSGSSLSLSQGIVGTPAYIAPEVWDMNAATVQADVYSLGCILYEMITGKTLFTGETPMQVLRAHDKGPRLPEQWPAGTPAGIVAVLQKAMARELNERYDSAESMCKALEDVQSQSTEAAAQQQRAAAAAAWRAEAESALNRKDWRAAEAAVQHWLEILPGNPSALALQQAVARRRSAEERQKQQEHTAPRPIVDQPVVDRPGGGTQPTPTGQDDNRRKRLIIALLAGAGLLACMIIGVAGANLLPGLFASSTEAAQLPTNTIPPAITQTFTLTTATLPLTPTNPATATATSAPLPTHTDRPPTATPHINTLTPLEFMVHYYDLLAQDQCEEAYAQLTDNYKSTFPAQNRYGNYEQWCVDVQHVEFLERAVVSEDGQSAFVRILLRWTFPNNQIVETRPMLVGLARDRSTRQWLIDTSVFTN